MNLPYLWVSVGVVLVTGLWVAVDARINRVPTYGDRYDMNTGAFCWFLGCLLLWIFVFPAYWVRRSAVLRRRVAQPSLEDQNRALREELRRLKEEPREIEAATAQPDHSLETSQQISAAVPLPRAPQQGRDADFDTRDVKIHLGSGGEFCAVLALLLPVIALCALFLGNFDSVPVELGIAIGTVVGTAILLAVDAASIGTVDLKGTSRQGVGAVLVGVMLLWFVFYPAAFFRRRHFGRPNLGILALVVAALFASGPLVKAIGGFDLLRAGDPPSCSSAEVVRLVNKTLDDSPAGPSIVSIRDHREIHYDPAARVRHGQCMVVTETSSTAVNYQVKWQDARQRIMHVQVEPYFSPDPPSCTSAEVTGMVESLIKNGAPGRDVIRVNEFKESRYDKASKTRHGLCTVHIGRFVAGRIGPPESFPVAFRVQLVDQKKGQFQVESGGVFEGWIRQWDASGDWPAADGTSGDAELRTIAPSKMEGYTALEIAGQLNCAPREVDSGQGGGQRTGQWTGTVHTRYWLH